jgi:hypothetical protein
MVIDSSVVINLPHDGEFRAKKRDGPAEIKPVEKSGNSDEPELDISRDRITEKAPETRRFDAGNLYNKYGEIDRDRSGNENAVMQEDTIDVIV